MLQAQIEAPKAPAGKGNGEVCPLHSQLGRRKVSQRGPEQRNIRPRFGAF